MTDDKLAELKSKVKRAEELKSLIGRLSRNIDKIKSATAVWFGIESGDFYVPPILQVNQSHLANIGLFHEVDGEDVPGLACDIRAAIVDALVARKVMAETELSEL